MRILAIDSSGLVASVALLDDDCVLADYSINYKKTHSQTLVPMLSEIKEMVNLDMETVDAIAVAGGPGSFTGLRIGSATAKGLGLAMGKPIIAVETVDGLAMNAWGYAGFVCPIMDARRDQVYTGIYRFEEGQLQVVKPQCAVSITEICEQLNTLEGPVLFLGDGVPVYQDKIVEQLMVPYEFAPAHMSRQRAAALGVLAARYYAEGRYESALEHKPDYLRLSQAERERLEKEGQG